MNVLLKETLNQLTRAFSQIEAIIPSPRWTYEHSAYRYADKSLETAIVQKLARVISGLGASTILLEHGFGQELAVLQRTLDEIGDDIFFLCLPLLGEPESKLHKEYLDAFYEEEFNETVGPLHSPQRRRMIPRKKIRARIANYQSKLSSLNPNDCIEIDRTVHKTYSGYVHAASPQIMDMYGGSPPHFHLHGMLDTPRIDGGQRSLYCHYFCRGIHQVILVARCFGLGALAEELREFVAQFETENGCVESRPSERRQTGGPENDVEAVIRYRRAAEQGNAAAQFGLGIVCAEGRGVRRDDQEAVKWYRRAAEQGYAGAQNSLGVMCEIGKDYQEAISWYRKAAEQHDVAAQCNLGKMYFYGWGVCKDDQEAVKWYRKAAEQDYVDAQYSLGQMYFDGEGVPQDYVQAHKWFNLATAREGEYREIDLAEVQRAKNESEKVMTGSQVAEAQRLAREWRPKTK